MSKLGRYARLGALAIALGALGCDDPPPQGPSKPSAGVAEAQRALLARTANDVVPALLADFEREAGELEEATEAWRAAPKGAAELEGARGAWRDAALSWQRVEVAQIGPIGRMASAIAGEDLRDPIYSWPTTSRCRIDAETARAGYAEDDFLEQALVNVRGLDAIEHLLWAPSSEDPQTSKIENACPSGSSINTSGEWAALNEETLAERRAIYAALIGADLSARAAALTRRWEAFAPSLADAGQNDSPYDSAQQGLNAIFDAMFYIEKETKDMKLGLPAGFGQACDEPQCPGALEFGLARASGEAALANLEGFEALYLGAIPGATPPEGEAAFGFDDLLARLDQEDLDRRIRARIEALREALQKTPFDDAVASNPAQSAATYEAAKALGDLLKTEFVGALDLEIPRRAEGDND